MKYNKILITGGFGFIGHHMVEHLHRHTDCEIIIVDKLSYASKGLERIRSMGLLYSERIKIFTWDLCSPLSNGLIQEFGDVDIILHLAAETHVDNSISEPIAVIQNNVLSTVHMLEYARKLPNLSKFFYFSTDEVYGSAPNDIMYKEWDVHNPTNPYSASKSAGEQFCLAYNNTYNVPIIITNCMNVFGERQHVEKFIPKVIDCLQKDIPLEIHADPTCKIPGSRFYIHARNVANAILFLIENGVIGDKYNIIGEKEVDNLEMALMIADIVNKPLKYTLVNFHKDRPGHDLRYALDGSKLIDMGWNLPQSFEQSLRKTIEWTLAHPEWLNFT